MSFYRQIDEASYDQLVGLWNGDVPDWADSRESLLDEIAFVLARSGADGVGVLKSSGNDTDMEKRKAAIAFLADTRIVDAEILGFLRMAFDTPDLGLKTRALWGYMHLGQFPLPRLELEALSRDPDPRIAALATIYLSRAFPEEAVSMLREALSSPNPRLREYACDEVGDRGIVELRVRLLELKDDPDEAVRQAVDSNK